MSPPPNPPALILVGWDFTRGSRQALRRAVTLAEEHCARIALVHVVAPEFPDDLRAIAEDDLRAEAKRWLTVPVEVGVAAGSPGNEIVGAAERLGADLIVVGAHGEHPLRQVALGSTAESVVHAAVPVLLVRPGPPEPYASVVLAVDTSEDSFRAARVGLALTPRARHALLHIAAVVGERLIRLHGARDCDLDHLQAGQLAAAAPPIERLRTDLLPSVTITLIAPGTPQVTVAEIAAERGADLVVVGAGGSSRLSSLLMGSVAQNSLRRTNCDVLLVPTSAASADRQQGQ